MIPFDPSGAFHPVAEGGELRRLAVRGAAATLSAAALSLGLRVIGTVLLARLLTPTDFGVVAMVTTFSLLLMSFGTSGLSEAVIQREEINESQASNLFWITCAIGSDSDARVRRVGPPARAILPKCAGCTCHGRDIDRDFR